MADPFLQNISGVQSLIESGTNKIHGGEDSPEGVVSDKIDILDLPMDDAELLRLRDDWEKSYATYEGKMKPIWERNLRSYLGKSGNSAQLMDADQPGAANLQFEAEETFLPAALARNPDPVVYSDNTPEGNKIADDVQTMLAFHADQLLLRRKLAVMVRQWSIYHLGVLKPGWNSLIQDVALENRKIQDFVFDPTGYVDVYGDFSSWCGERITVTAERLIDLFPKEKQYILGDIGGKEFLGTDVVYTEWWTDDYCFSTYKKVVLDKHKNEYFNYEEEGATGLGDIPVPGKQRNHFASPKKPYIFLSVFSLQEHPHDITGLIEQNIPNQKKISKRTEQIDENVSSNNNGIAFSEDNFNQETAKQAANALKRGSGQVLVPPGKPVEQAIVRLPAVGFPESAFRDLENSENHLRSSWGVQGIASQEQKPDTTARGMVLNQGRDTSRIGGGISDIVEQSVARGVFNWLVQLYAVFYDEKHFAATMGVGKSVEYVQLSAQSMDRQLIVTVSPNSMKPKDELTTMNQATELFQMGAIGPKVLLETLNYPNSDESAADGVLWKMSMETDAGRTYIQMNFPELWQQLQQIIQQQQMEQQQAQQQQMQIEAQQGQQQIQQKGAQGQQQIQQKEQAHAQQMRHGEEQHQAKVTQFKDIASAKLASQKSAQPKK